MISSKLLLVLYKNSHLKVSSQKLLWPDLVGFGRIWFGFGRIRLDLVGFGRILASGKFGQNWSDLVGIGRIWSELVGFGRNRSDLVEFRRRIRSE